MIGETLEPDQEPESIDAYYEEEKAQPSVQYELVGIFAERDEGDLVPQALWKDHDGVWNTEYDTFE